MNRKHKYQNTYYFLRKFNEKYGFNKTLDSEVIKLLLNYDWPGNVRELENLIERLVVVSEKNSIGVENLPSEISDKIGLNKAVIKITGIMPLKQAIKKVEDELISLAFQKYSNIKDVADALQVHRTTIIRKRRKLKK